MEWRAIPGYEGWYEVSDSGQVRSVTRTITHSDGRVRCYPAVTRRQYTDGYGYRKVTLNRNSTDWRVHVHVLVALAFIGPRSPGLDVCHNDGNCLNNSPSNLRYDTPKGNRQDSVKHGTSIRPSMRKVDDAAVSIIRAARGALSVSTLSFIFGISKPHVCSIQKGVRRA